MPLFAQHDPMLVLLAILVCASGSFGAIHLFAQARRERGAARLGWLFVTGMMTGVSIWTTHFVAMLGFDPGVPASYEPLLSSASFMIALAATAFGFAVAALEVPLAAPVGGAVVGLGIGVMHATGMLAFRVAGTVEWDFGVAAVALAVGVVFGALALWSAATRRSLRDEFAAAGLLAAAIVGLHGTAMAALTVHPDPSRTILPELLPNRMLGVTIGTIGIFLTAMGLAAAVINQSYRQRARARLRHLADASVEGLILAEECCVLDVNSSLLDLLGHSDGASLVGRRLDQIVAAYVDGARWFETELSAADGSRIPVEVIVREAAPGYPNQKVLAIRDLRERRAAEARIRYLAHFDTLTGLPNRSTFQQRLQSDIEAAGRRGGMLSLMLLDLDRFKEVNDIYGHLAGDSLLAQVAERMKRVIGADVFLARLGGDEFVVVQPDGDETAAADLAERLMAAMDAVFAVNGQEFSVGLTVGVALYPRDGKDGTKLLSHADMALYQAKGNGRRQACFFRPVMVEAVRERSALAQDLKAALRLGQFTVHYQPQVALPSGEPVGFEALLRWPHPEKGMIAPSRFIPVAEETRLIYGIGEWVLRSVCREAASWPKPYKVSVNLSPVQFKQADLVEQVHSILLETGLSPSRLELEVTESALMDDMRRALHVLRQLTALGVGIAMDDFGTGYSSLANLQAFRFGRLKLDRSFIRYLGARRRIEVIVRAVLRLGDSLGVEVLAEGVETQAQRAWLEAEGCALAQGYLFGAPAPIEAHAALFADPTPPEQRLLAAAS